jgi:mono/diheme cytochrome c family protein
MPDFGLTDEQVASLMSYLLAERPQAREPLARGVLGRPEAVEEEDSLISMEAPRRRFLQGEALFMRYCSLCHGEEGNGRGFNAKFLPREPRDFTDADYMSKKSDEDLYQVISGGGASAGLSFLMPPWGRTLNKGEIQDLISYLRRFSDSHR